MSSKRLTLLVLLTKTFPTFSTSPMVGCMKQVTVERDVNLVSVSSMADQEGTDRATVVTMMNGSLQEDFKNVVKIAEEPFANASEIMIFLNLPIIMIVILKLGK